MVIDDGENRRTVPEHLEPDLRLYRRLCLAEDDLLEAKAALDELLASKISLSRRNRPPPLVMSLTTGMVISYARPWVTSRGHSVAEKAVPGSLLRSLTAKQREMHDYLINLRNKHVAHSDADVLDLSLRLFPDGHSAILRDFKAPFARSNLRYIRVVIEKLERAFENKFSELRKVLPNHTWI